MPQIPSMSNYTYYYESVITHTWCGTWLSTGTLPLTYVQAPGYFLLKVARTQKC
jgi:hypothetical protein